jgi:(4-(4-[2-(gamma-L-glutamylamino)ethyl]phenoxymethyl)furan-2-yl)methanamine synthase
VASANWHVLARWVASWIECPSLLLDIGSTTTDLIPLSPHCVETQSISDFDRLVRNELVYLGIQRTPVCAIVDSLPHRGLSVPIIREKFATTDDCCLLLGWTPEDPLDRETCDSMPRTRLAASNRMARLIGLDQRSVLLDDAVAMASHAMNAATQIIHNATEFHQRHGQSQWIVSGHGNRLLSVPFGVRQVDLNVRLGNDVSRVAPAFAICKWMQQTQHSTISQS